MRSFLSFFLPLCFLPSLIDAQTLSSKFAERAKIGKQLPVALQAWKITFASPVAMIAIPGAKQQFVVLEKGGNAFTTDGVSKTVLLTRAVHTRSEMGLLGLAFHPQFASKRKFYLNYNPKGEKNLTRIEEWVWPENGQAKASKILLEVEQPYANHNAGDLQFGPDGLLYIGMGDGGSGGDPEQHGQNLTSLLGSMLRIDVDRTTKNKPYAIPRDNPFPKNKWPEIYAYGLRNPWRYSFDPLGRLIVADVGQYLWEELTFVYAGDNLGWNIWEGKHCFGNAKCQKPPAYREPFFEYDRQIGSSITGGFVCTAKSDKKLSGKYIFGDFVSGQLLAVDLPAKGSNTVRQVYDLGKFALSPASFGRDDLGQVYVVDYQKGRIYLIKSI